MPTRRTSPRRTATRPSGLDDRSAGPTRDDDLDEPRSVLESATPWLAVLAVVLSAAALGYVVLGRSGGDLTACRTAAWSAIPSRDDLPRDWNLGSTDLNANGMTISILGPAPADGSTSQPVVYASVTCYGDAAPTALEENRKAAEAAGSTVTARSASGLAYDVDNPLTGSVTTLFRVGGLVGQVADGGTANPSELATITTAVAAAMGDEKAAGNAGAAASDEPSGSDGPLGSNDVGGVEPSGSPFAPELEALLPTSVRDTTSTASPPPSIPLTVISASASEVFGEDPSSRALAARVRALGSTFEQLQVAQAYDESGTIEDVSIIAFRLPKADTAKLRAAILETFLSAGADGVTTSTVTLAGKTLTKVDYGDDRTNEYVYTAVDAVIVIDTSDEAIATDLAAQLK
jgi:hypothetical protein